MKAKLVVFVTIVLTTTGLASAQDGASPWLAAEILALLQSGEISAGASDAVLANSPGGASITRDGDYTVYSFAGLDETTDRISLLSHNGEFFYAHYESCSDSETYFNVKSSYFRYLLQAR